MVKNWRQRSNIYRVGKSGVRGGALQICNGSIESADISLHTAPWDKNLEWSIRSSRPRCSSNWKQKPDKAQFKRYLHSIYQVDFHGNSLPILTLFSETILKITTMVFSLRYRYAIVKFSCKRKRQHIPKYLMTCIIQEVKPDKPRSLLSFIIC